MIRFVTKEAWKIHEVHPDDRDTVPLSIVTQDTEELVAMFPTAVRLLPAHWPVMPYEVALERARQLVAK
jgi:hypothetical protein